MGSPRWGKEAEEECKELVEGFQSNLRRIVTRLAAHERADSVDRRHVTNAFESLVNCGLERTVWWKRPQLKITAAGICMALAFATPDFCPRLANGNQTLEVVLFWVGVIIFAVLALGLYSWGWTQNRL